MDETVIVVVDDQRETLDLIEEALAAPARKIHCFDDPTNALAFTADKRVDFVLTDLRMPRKTGLEVLSEVKARSNDIEVILMTAHADVELAVQAMKNGASDFFTKPLRIEELTTVVNRLVEYQAMRRRLKDLIGDDVAPVGTGAAIQRVLSQAQAVAETDATVLLLGETGVGKEVLADYIHRHSPRKPGPYIKINCAALPETLLESELFGHEKGAFTGAVDRRLGRFERAHTGTLFLDEIAELSMPVQVKLLRVLQNHEIERIGGSQTVPIDFRLICATHRNLQEMVQSGRFREDLYYRINVFPVHIPPLRERREDLPALVYHFLKRASSKIGRGPEKVLPEAMSRIGRYHWPGNVRELENVIERACVLSRGNLLTPDLIVLPQSTQAAAGEGSVEAGRDSGAVKIVESAEAKSAVPETDAPSPEYLPSDGAAPWISESKNPLEEAEKATIRMVLERCRWNFVHAARILNLSRSTLYARACKHGIRRNDTA